jgi:tetratricopeptide (TPR) repeat protein
MDQIKRYQKALAAAEEVIREHPEDPTAHHNRGVVLSKLGRFQDALEAFHTAVLFKRNFARAYYNLGLTLRLMGRLPEAINAFDKAAEFKPNIPIVFDKRAAALIDLGASLNKLEYARSLFESAIRDAERAIELSTDAEGHYNMACALSRIGEHDKALEHLAKAKGVKGIEFDAAHVWEDPDFNELRKPPCLEKFTKIVGAQPERSDVDTWK